MMFVRSDAIIGLLAFGTISSLRGISALQQLSVR
jgi:hypothetical protein